MQETKKCPKCNDTGEIVIREQHSHGASIATNLCECRRGLPRRHGKVSWWDSEVVYEEKFRVCDGVLLDSRVSISRELPVSADNFPLHRTNDNSRFSNSIAIEIDCTIAPSDMLREFAAFLLKMADKSDELDQPYPDEVFPQPTEIR